MRCVDNEDFAETKTQMITEINETAPSKNERAVFLSIFFIVAGFWETPDCVNFFLVCFELKFVFMHPFEKSGVTEPQI